MKTPTCVQCQKEMPYAVNIRINYKLSNETMTEIASVCTNPKCPNYGLLQVGEEKMFAIETALRKK